jgi:hypothetical protein
MCLLLCLSQSIFRTPVSSYDVLIEFHPECLPHPNRVLFPPEGLGKSVLSKAAPKLSPWLSPSILKMGIRAARDHIIIGLNPVEEFVQDLKVRLRFSPSLPSISLRFASLLLQHVLA